MIPSSSRRFLLAAAFLAACGTFSRAEDSPHAAYLRQSILTENNPHAASNFLADENSRRQLKASDPALYQDVFQRAAELKDLEGLLGGTADTRSIRLSLLERPSCSFCLDAAAFPAWARKHLSYLDPDKFQELEAALWSWDSLSQAQKEWVRKKNKASAWPALDFFERHDVMREWALGERDALLKINPADSKSLDGFYDRGLEVKKILDKDETSAMWRHFDQAAQAVESLAQARAKVAKSVDPRQRALLAQAVGAGSPEERLAALSRFFENSGESPRELLAAAPPRPDQRFDDSSRKVVAALLKTALLKETAGTFAGGDLKQFYVDRKIPLEVEFSNTSESGLGWYEGGSDVLNFNERYLEQYVKSRGASIADLKTKPALLQDLARTLAGTFVHEAQHHRQDVWARDNKISAPYHQGDEVEAFQVQALFLMEKVDHDPKFRAFAETEGRHSDIMRAGLERARRLKEQGPEYFEWIVPNTHYPNVLSNEGNAWSAIARGDRSAGQASEIYLKLRARQEAMKQLTMKRFKILESGVKSAGPPPPAGEAKK